MTGWRCAWMLGAGETATLNTASHTFLCQAFITAMKETSWSSWPSISWL